MPITVSQIAIEEPDKSYPKMPKPPEKFLSDPEMKAWWSSMEAWWRDAVRSLRN